MEEKFEKWQEYMAEAVEASEEGKYDEAIKFIDLAVKEGCIDNEHHAFRGECNIQLSNYQATIEDLTIYLDNAKEDVDMYWYRGFAYMKMGNFEAALVDFEKGFNHISPEAGHYYYRGICFYNLHEYKKAIEDLVMSEKLGLTDNSLYRFRGAANFFLNRMVKAKKDLLHFLKLNDKDSSVYFLLSIIEEKKKNYEEALKHINHAIYLDGDSKVNYERRRQLYILTDQPEKAQEDLLRIKKLTPEVKIDWHDGTWEAKLEQLKAMGIIDEYRLPDEE